MALTYKFKKERLENGVYVARPKILVQLSGAIGSIRIPALIDSGCDTTVIPKSLAEAIGLSMSGNKNILYAYHEASEVIESSATITFLGKEPRQSVSLNVPVLITIPKDDSDEEIDIVLGINGIFEMFDITFKKAVNKIILKQVRKN